jgi:hypothetical protein
MIINLLKNNTNEGTKALSAAGRQIGMHKA